MKSLIRALKLRFPRFQFFGKNTLKILNLKTTADSVGKSCLSIKDVSILFGHIMCFSICFYWKTSVYCVFAVTYEILRNKKMLFQKKKKKKKKKNLFKKKKKKKKKKKIPKFRFHSINISKISSLLLINSVDFKLGKRGKFHWKNFPQIRRGLNRFLNIEL